MAAAGCAIIRQGYDTPTPEIGHFRDGKTHYRDVLRDLGPPASLSAEGDGLVFLYEHVEIGENQLGISIEYKGIPIIKLVAGRGSADGGTTVLTFDGAGMLQGSKRETWSRSLGSGAGVQTAFSVMSVTDPGGFDEPPASRNWGVDLLKARLPEALNRGSDLKTGQSGVERKGSPLGAGQHTLELSPLFGK
jgi:hypothetical protein